MRTRRYIGVFIATISMVSIGHLKNAVADNVWRVSLDQAQCIQHNAELYQQAGLDPIIIVVRSCPETDLVAAMQSVTENSGLFGLQEGDDIIIMTSDELECFRQKNLIPHTNGYIEINKEDPCD
ncbi:MAG: hypothetical protein Rhims3KO_20440 [Hyphomicrobiales bacterium]